jgi:hypothetical protein
MVLYDCKNWFTRTVASIYDRKNADEIALIRKIMPPGIFGREIRCDNFISQCVSALEEDANQQLLCRTLGIDHPKENFIEYTFRSLLEQKGAYTLADFNKIRNSVVVYLYTKLQEVLQQDQSSSSSTEVSSARSSIRDDGASTNVSVATVAPEEPVATVAPVGPVATVAPVAPVASVAPVEPVAVDPAPIIALSATEFDAFARLIHMIVLARKGKSPTEQCKMSIPVTETLYSLQSMSDDIRKALQTNVGNTTDFLLENLHVEIDRYVQQRVADTESQALKTFFELDKNQQDYMISNLVQDPANASKYYPAVAYVFQYVTSPLFELVWADTTVKLGACETMVKPSKPAFNTSTTISTSTEISSDAIGNRAVGKAVERVKKEYNAFVRLLVVSSALCARLISEPANITVQKPVANTSASAARALSNTSASAARASSNTSASAARASSNRPAPTVSAKRRN